MLGGGTAIFARERLAQPRKYKKPATERRLEQNDEHDRY